jgi:hypothetical protein
MYILNRLPSNHNRSRRCICPTLTEISTARQRYNIVIKAADTAYTIAILVREHGHFWYFVYTRKLNFVWRLTSAKVERSTYEYTAKRTKYKWTPKPHRGTCTISCKEQGQHIRQAQCKSDRLVYIQSVRIQWLCQDLSDRLVYIRSVRIQWLCQTGSCIYGVCEYNGCIICCDVVYIRSVRIQWLYYMLCCQL